MRPMVFPLILPGLAAIFSEPFRETMQRSGLKIGRSIAENVECAELRCLAKFATRERRFPSLPNIDAQCRLESLSAVRQALSHDRPKLRAIWGPESSHPGPALYSNGARECMETGGVNSAQEPKPRKDVWQLKAQ